MKSPQEPPNELVISSEPSELVALSQEMFAVIEERAIIIQRAIQRAEQLGNGVTWRDLVPPNFGQVVNVSIGTLIGTVNVTENGNVICSDSVNGGNFSNGDKIINIDNIINNNHSGCNTVIGNILNDNKFTIEGNLEIQNNNCTIGNQFVAETATMNLAPVNQQNIAQEGGEATVNVGAIQPKPCEKLK
jgi:hypothetical protein